MSNPVNISKQHYYYLDILNIVATFAVVCLHTSDYVFQFSPNEPNWYLSLLIQILFIWAVPIFFMISGANLLNYRERYDTKVFFKKRCVHVLFPFIFWSLTWYVWNYVALGMPGWSIKNFWYEFEQNSIQPIFWFFYYIIPVYIAMPFLSIIANNKNKKIVEYIIFLYVLGTGIVNYIYTLLHRSFDMLVANIPLALEMGIGIFFVGWYLHNYKISDKARHLIYIFSIMFGVFVYFLTIYMSFKQGHTAREAYSIFSIGGFILPIGVWLFCQHHFNNWKPSSILAKWLNIVSNTSLGVYVIHEFIIQILEHFLNFHQIRYFIYSGCH